MKKKWFYYPSFLSKQGCLFKAAKSKYGIMCFNKVNLFKINNFVKKPKSMGGGKILVGSKFNSWGIVNHLIEDDNPGIYIFFKSTANVLISKTKTFKQLKLELN